MKTLKVNQNRENIVVADFVYEKAKDVAFELWQYIRYQKDCPKLYYGGIQIFHTEVFYLDLELDHTLCSIYEATYKKDYVGEYKNYCMLYNVVRLNWGSIIDEELETLKDVAFELTYPFDVYYRYEGVREEAYKPIYEVALTIPYQVDSGLLDEMEKTDKKDLKKDWGITDHMLEMMKEAKFHWDYIEEEEPPF